MMNHILANQRHLPLRWTGVVFVMALTLLIMWGQTASAAQTIRVLPQTYSETLDKGEIKKGYIDVINPGQETLELKTSVKGFRQIDDDGNLEFYDSEEIEAGIEVDLDTFKLNPEQAMRLYFQIDGSKLPSGDVFATVFVQTVADGNQNFKQSARVGTLLMLENGTPGSRQASISNLDVSFWQPGSRIVGSYSVRNEAEPGESTGFRPEVRVGLTPFGARFDQQASLVFAGRERVNDMSIETQLPGLYYMELSHGSSSVGSWVLLTPLWSVMVAVIAFLGMVIVYKYRNQSKKVYKNIKK